MSAEKLVKETKLIIGVSLFASLALLITWTTVELMNTSFGNDKALLALSIIPLSAALASYLKLIKINKDPQKMVAETDERLVAEKNEADAKALKLLQGILFLTYMGYTFIFPEETFQSLGWWVTLGILLLSLFAPVMIRHMLKES
ncbi:hypothetical protein LCM20_08795 [Halobacillus litoralis]|uniref:hypothetical protein n=1 Tax=Halobacillus litoralis TaxID=45668 RepID=UPI001CD3A5FD|nr:hypothetical protein [Halobacillus litoralis]MCA0970683.1 hypothetical protein [Halobacillus litoralis]